MGELEHRGGQWSQHYGVQDIHDNTCVIEVRVNDSVVGVSLRKE